ncbi:hypothetical protein IWX91DRAFT_342472 [Phyllosticta citricarpa]
MLLTGPGGLGWLAGWLLCRRLFLVSSHLRRLRQPPPFIAPYKPPVVSPVVVRVPCNSVRDWLACVGGRWLATRRYWLVCRPARLSPTPAIESKRP